MGGRHLPNFLGTSQTVPRSPHCYHLQDPSAAHKQLKTKTVIPINDSESTKKFSRDKKEMTVEELSEIIIDFLAIVKWTQNSTFQIHKIQQSFVSSCRKTWNTHQQTCSDMTIMP